MKMSNMSDTKRITQSWRHAALNHTSPFSPFYLLASALLRSPNGHDATETRSSTTSKLQSCKSCFVIFHPRKPGSGSQTLGSQGNPIALLGGAGTVTPLAWIQIHAWENPHQEMGYTYSVRCCCLRGGTSFTTRVRAPSPTPFKTRI